MSKQGNVFINGKEQVIELLQFLPDHEREKLIQNLRARNASMAKELDEKSLSFKHLVKLNDSEISKVFSRVTPPIIGLALYLCSRDFQRKVLSNIPRESAERAFQIMNKDLTTKRNECLKAQERILNVAIGLSRKNVINL